MEKTTLCERTAAPLLFLHGKTTPPLATVCLGAIGAGVVALGLFFGSPHIAWAGLLVTTVGWYGFLLSGCEKLLARKERELVELKKQIQSNP